MTTKEIDTYLKEHKEDQDVQDLVKGLQAGLSPDAVKTYLEEDGDGKRLFSSLTDKKVTQSIKTFSENHNAKTKEELKTELKQGYDTRISAIEKAKAEYDSKAEQEQIAFEFGIANGYSKQQVALCKASIGENRESTLKNLELIKTSLAEREQKVKDAILESHGVTPGGGGLEETELFSKERLENMSPEEQSQNMPKVLKSVQQL